MTTATAAGAERRGGRGFRSAPGWTPGRRASQARGGGPAPRIALLKDGGRVHHPFPALTKPRADPAQGRSALQKAVPPPVDRVRSLLKHGGGVGDRRRSLLKRVAPATAPPAPLPKDRPSLHPHPPRTSPTSPSAGTQLTKPKPAPTS
ncbi:MAG: hypothetical protein ACK56I_11080, partial [bacterium]